MSRNMFPKKECPSNTKLLLPIKPNKQKKNGAQCRHKYAVKYFITLTFHTHFCAAICRSFTGNKDRIMKNNAEAGIKSQVSQNKSRFLTRSLTQSTVNLKYKRSLVTY